MNRAELLWYWLGTAPGVGPRRAAAAAQAFPDLEEAFAAPGELAACGFPKNSIEALWARADMALLQAEVAAMEERHIHIATAISPAYPKLLAETACPPTHLYYMGDLQVASEKPFAVAGSRKPTRSGAANIQSICRELAESGVAVISGMAMGMDAAAHRGALDGRGKTIAVLGSGVDKIYPAAHIDLYYEIIESGGAVVSEFSPGVPAMPKSFPQRNRIIAGMAQGLLLGEGRPGGGGNITVNFALAENRDVFAMPGDISSPEASLPNQLIADGAIAALGADSILDYYGWRKGMRHSGVSTALPAPPAGLDAAEQAIYAYLAAGEATAEQIGQNVNIPQTALSVGLTKLELKGMIVREAGNRFGIVRQNGFD